MNESFISYHGRSLRVVGSMEVHKPGRSSRPRDMIEDTKKRKQLQKIIEGAINVFSARGYKEAQMSHIAQEAGIALGTLYLYFKSKESLFNFLFQYSFADEQDLDEMSVPISSPSWDSGRDACVSSEFSALFDDAFHGGDIEDVHEEFEKIVRNLFSTLRKYRHGIRILLRSSPNSPQLAEFYAGLVKGLLDLLAAYLDKRIGRGLIREVPSVSASARFILESIAWFAVHRHRSTHQAAFSEKIGEDTLVDALTHAFIPEHLREQHRARA